MGLQQKEKAGLYDPASFFNNRIETYFLHFMILDAPKPAMPTSKGTIVSSLSGNDADAITSLNGCSNIELTGESSITISAASPPVTVCKLSNQVGVTITIYVIKVCQQSVRFAHHL
jgi:hypothetical protein